jgi:hypothetical protein
MMRLGDFDVVIVTAQRGCFGTNVDAQAARRGTRDPCATHPPRLTPSGKRNRRYNINDAEHSYNKEERLKTARSPICIHAPQNCLAALATSLRSVSVRARFYHTAP